MAGDQADKNDQQATNGEAAEAEGGKDDRMSPSQARSLLRSVEDEEAHQLINQQNRAVDQPVRDW